MAIANDLQVADRERLHKAMTAALSLLLDAGPGRLDGAGGVLDW